MDKRKMLTVLTLGVLVVAIFVYVAPVLASPRWVEVDDELSSSGPGQYCNGTCSQNGGSMHRRQCSECEPPGNTYQWCWCQSSSQSGQGSRKNGSGQRQGSGCPNK